MILTLDSIKINAKMMMMMIHKSYDQFTTSIMFCYILYLLLQGWYRNYNTHNYHRKQNKGGFVADIFKRKPDVLGYRYDTLSPFPLLVHDSRTESTLKDMLQKFMSNNDVT